jgi:hypothetical protein
VYASLLRIYYENNNCNTADCREIAKFKQQKKNKDCFEAKAGPGKKSLAFLVILEEINPLKRQQQLKPEKTASNNNNNINKRKAESLIHPLY